MDTINRLKEIQERLQNALNEKFKKRIIWNQTLAYALFDHAHHEEEFLKHALDDMTWLMQQYVTMEALLKSKQDYIEDLKNRFIYNQGEE